MGFKNIFFIFIFAIAIVVLFTGKLMHWAPTITTYKRGWSQPIPSVCFYAFDGL